MNVTVVVDDQVVNVDNDPEFFAFTLPDPDIRVIQWKDTKGEIEYYSKGNEAIDDFTPYQSLLDQRTTARDQRIANDTQAEADKLAQHLANMTPKQKRWNEYPTIEDQLEALYEARQGDATKLIAVDTLIASINAKYPL